jgi:hypothetical protein
VRAYAGAIVACIVFLGMVRVVGLLQTPNAVYRVAREALRDLGNADLDDDAKEVLMRRHSLAFGRQFLRITGSTVVALGVPLALLWLLDRAGVVSLSRVLATLSSWQFLVGATLVIGAGLLLRRRTRLGS